MFRPISPLPSLVVCPLRFVFKARAGARGYQTLINEALKQAIEHESLEDTLRRVIRKEAAPYKVGGKGR